MVSTILRNLISNAVKFTNPGGEIVVSVDQNQDEIVVTVADNGVGIKNEAETNMNWKRSRLCWKCCPPDQCKWK